jgi:hypothetical protein
LVYPPILLARWIQNALAEPLWWISKATLFLVLRNKDPRFKARYVADREKWFGRLGFFVFTWAGEIHAKLAGLRKDRRAYEQLLSWNAHIPVIGFTRGDEKSTLLVLSGPPKSEGSRASNFYWTHATRPVGRIRILERSLSSSGDVLVLCGWTSGPRAGRTFIIGPETSTTFSEDDGTVTPNLIYGPPQMLTLLCEVVVSAAILLPILGLLQQAWKAASTWALLHDLLGAMIGWLD